MRLLIDSFWRAAAYCLHPRVIALSLLPLVLMVVLGLGLVHGYWTEAVAAMRGLLDARLWLAGLWNWLAGLGLGQVQDWLAPLLVHAGAGGVGKAVAFALARLGAEAGEVLDATFMSAKALRSFLEEQIEDAKRQGVLFSLHMKATMMKVSDPKIFGHAVRVYYKDVFEKHGETLKKLGVDPDNGIGDL